MASTITSANLTVTISESIQLNGQDINSENQLVIPDINEYDKRIVTIPFASEIQFINFSTAVASGTYIAANVKYMRVSNKDNTNFVRIRVKNAGAETFDIKLEAGKSWMMGNPSESANITGAAFVSFVNATSINAQADTANVDVEFVVASI